MPPESGEYTSAPTVMICVLFLLLLYTDTGHNGLKLLNNKRTLGRSRQRPSTLGLQSNLQTSTQAMNHDGPTTSVLVATPREAKEVHDTEITLITTFFARNSKTSQMRYDELQMALLANWGNPVLNELIIVYEETSSDNCAALLARLRAVSNTIPPTIFGRPPKPIRCLPQRGSQPTYAQIFEFANGLRDRLVVIANCDVVFDATLSSAPLLKSGQAYALSVNTPPNWSMYHALSNMFNRRVGGTPKSYLTDQRCPWKNKGIRANSMDAWMIRPPINGVIMQAEAHGYALNTTMNRAGAENRAFCGLVAGGLNVTNACPFIHMAHWHRSRVLRSFFTALFEIMLRVLKSYIIIPSFM